MTEKSSAGLRPHGPWRTGEIRVLFETLALYSYMTFENAKVAKNWKRIILTRATLASAVFAIERWLDGWMSYAGIVYGLNLS